LASDLRIRPYLPSPLASARLANNLGTRWYLCDFMVFFRPGDIVKFKPIDRDGYDQAVEDVDNGRFAPPIREVSFDLREFHKDIDRTNAKLEGALHGH